jgi:hypothetical protein
MTDEVAELAERLDRLPEWSRDQMIDLIRLLLPMAEREPKRPPEDAAREGESQP